MANTTVHDLAPTLSVGATGHRDLIHEEIAQRLGGAGFESPPPPLGSGSDDRAALIAWLASVPANTTIGFQHGYLVSAPLPLPSGHRYIGRGVAENDPAHITLMNGANPAAATTGVVVSKEWDDNTSAGGVPTIYENLHINGNAANNTGTYSCLIPFNYWTRIVNCRFDSPRLHHVLLTKLMKNGSASSIDHADNRIYGNRFRVGLTGTDGAGVRQVSSGGAGNHNMDIRIFDNHFESCQHGIWLEDSAGWTIMDNHLWCRRHAINIDNGFLASQVIANYVDGFGNDNTAGQTYYGIRVRGFNGLGTTVALNTVDITEDITTATFYCYWLEAQNAGATITGGLNKAYGHATPNSAHHGFMYGANNGATINGQFGNTAVGFVAGQDFETADTGSGGTITTLYPRPISGTASWTPGAIGGGAGATQSVTVTGAALGDPVAVGYNQNLADGLVLTGEVSAANTVTAQLRNVTGGSITPTAGTVRATVWKH